MTEEYTEVSENRRVYKGWTVQRTDPYGFWVILDSKGRRSDYHPNSYTQISIAIKDIDTVKIPEKKKRV